MVTTASQAAVQIAAWFDGVFGELDELSARISSTLLDARGARSRFTEADLKPVKLITAGFLARQSVVAAAGVILAPGTIDPNRGTIEWWRHDDQGITGKVVFNLTPQTGSFYDFATLPWFDNAVKNANRTLTGPYVDFGGLDQYIMTMTVPLELGADVIGMVGCDIDVRAIETVIVPILRRIPGDAALLSADQHVILGNSGRFLVGNRVRSTPENGGLIPVDSPFLGLSLVCAQHADYR